MVGWRRSSKRHPQPRQPLYDFIAARIDPATGKLPEAGLDLPDEASTVGESGLRFAPGAMDGIGTHHASFDAEGVVVADVSRRLVQIARLGRIRDMDEFASFVAGKDTLGFVDKVRDELARANVPAQPHLRSLAQRMVKTGSDRSVVKLGLALLGWAGLPEDAEPLLVLGLHDEFTLFAAVALSNLLGPENAEVQLWALAKRVDGWGRIQLVERMVPPRDPAIREWLLRGGYRNQIMNEYLTWIAAVHGNLADAVQRPVIDDELFDSIGDIIDGLISGGPAQDISDYPQGPDVVTRYLEVLSQRPRPTIRHFLVANQIRHFLHNAGRPKPIWTDTQTAKCLALLAAIRKWPEWVDQARNGLQSEDQRTFSEADRAASILGLDRFPGQFARLKSKPDEVWLWSSVMETAGPSHVDEVLQLAATRLSLEPRAAAGKSPLAVDPLEFVIQGLVNYPGKGLPFLLAGLRHPGIRARRGAASALSKWFGLPEEARNALMQARAGEKETDIQTLIDQALSLPGVGGR